MRIGKRQIKTVCAVFCCLIISIFIQSTKITVLNNLYTPFFAALATVYCISQDKDQSLQMAKIRGGGSILGGIVGFLVISFSDFIELQITNIFVGNIIAAGAIAISIIIVIKITVFFKWQKLTFIACLTYLSVTVGSRADLSSLMFASNRIISSLIGILIALGINNMNFNTKNYIDIEKEFYLNVDNFNEIEGYVRQKINFYLKNNLKIYFYTNYSPYEVLDKFQGLNVDKIYALGGDLIYDVRSYKFLHSTTFSNDKKIKLENFFTENNFSVFKYILKDEVLLCSYNFELTEADYRFIRICNKHHFHNFIKENSNENAINYAFTFTKEERKKVELFFENFECYTYIEEDDKYCFIRVFDNSLSQDKNHIFINFNLDYKKNDVIIKNQVDIIKIIHKELKIKS